MSILDARPRLPAHVVYRAFPNETVMMNLETGQYHGLNTTGGRMLKALESADTVRAAAAEIAAEYERPTEEIEADLTQFCADLQQRGLIDMDGSPPQ